MEDDATAEEPISPASQTLQILPRVVAPAAEDEVVAMLVEANRYQDDAETRVLASRLLEAGYTVQTVANRLDLRVTTVWRWANEPDVRAAIESGREQRRRTLGQDLEQAANGALTTLVGIANDLQVNPRDRVKAATEILDRCGIAPAQESAGPAAAVAVDIDFDERLARIVATTAVPPDKP